VGRGESEFQSSSRQHFRDHARCAGPNAEPLESGDHDKARGKPLHRGTLVERPRRIADQHTYSSQDRLPSHKIGRSQDDEKAHRSSILVVQVMIVLDRLPDSASTCGIRELKSYLQGDCILENQTVQERAFLSQTERLCQLLAHFRRVQEALRKSVLARIHVEDPTRLQPR